MKIGNLKYGLLILMLWSVSMSAQDETEASIPVDSFIQTEWRYADGWWDSLPAFQEFTLDTLTDMELSEDTWKALKEELPFKKPSKPDRGEDPSPTEETDWQPSEGLSMLLKLIFLAGGIALLIFLGAQLFGKGSGFFNRGGKKVNPKVGAISVENLEEALMEAPLVRMLREARAANTYPEVIRLLYLSIIKKMADHDWVKWQPNTTNQEYLSQVQDFSADKGRTFSSLTRIYESVWYGDYELDDSTFRQIEPWFTTFLDQIQ